MGDYTEFTHVEKNSLYDSEQENKEIIARF